MKKALFVMLAALMTVCIANVFVLAEDVPSLSVESIEVPYGTLEVEVNINIENNPGVASGTVMIGYDEALTVKEGKAAAPFDGMATWSETHKNPIRFIWIVATSNVTDNGRYCSVVFTVPSDAAVGDVYNVTVANDPGNTFNVDDEEVTFEGVAGAITIVPPNGDANADGRTNMKDAIAICKHVADWKDVIVDRLNADVNMDGKINLKDAASILKAIAEG